MQNLVLLLFGKFSFAEAKITILQNKDIFELLKCLYHLHLFVNVYTICIYR